MLRIELSVSARFFKITIFLYFLYLCKMDIDNNGKLNR